MRTLINKFILICAIMAISGHAMADEPQTIRVINVDVKKYSKEYDKAMNSDPWHGFNMAMFKFNNALDQYLVEPLARSYRFAVPQWGRDRVSNVFSNLGEPRNFVNSLLQGDVEGMFRSFWRFTINTTFGVAGINDVASGFGLKQKQKGFSQTMALYGIGSGPYLVLPFYGPSTARDAFGLGGDVAANPVTYTEDAWPYIIGGVDLIQQRESILDYTDDVKRNSFDVYSTYKSAYLQNRKKKVLSTLE